MQVGRGCRLGAKRRSTHPPDTTRPTIRAQAKETLRSKRPEGARKRGEGRARATAFEGQAAPKARKRSPDSGRPARPKPRFCTCRVPESAGGRSEAEDAAGGARSAENAGAKRSGAPTARAGTPKGARADLPLRSRAEGAQTKAGTGRSHGTHRTPAAGELPRRPIAVRLSGGAEARHDAPCRGRARRVGAARSEPRKWRSSAAPERGRGERRRRNKGVKAGEARSPPESRSAARAPRGFTGGGQATGGAARCVL